jgi:hypothetical protein
MLDRSEALIYDQEDTAHREKNDYKFMFVW